MLRFTFILLLFVFNACMQLQAQAVNRLATKSNQQTKAAPKVKSSPIKTKTSLSPATDTVGWTDKDRENFLRICEPATGFGADSARVYCRCMLQKIENLYPVPADADKKLSSEKAIALARECLSQQSGNSIGWFEGDRKAYMSDCKTKYAKNIGAEKIEAYCTCMMQKTETAYPNPLDAKKATSEELNKWVADCNKQ